MEMRQILMRSSSTSDSPDFAKFTIPESVNLRKPTNVNSIIRGKTMSTLRSESTELILRRKDAQMTRHKQYNSLIAIEQMVECNICAKRQRDPRMLTCQHTFCYNCCKYLLERTPGYIECPTCQHRTTLLSLLTNDGSNETTPPPPIPKRNTPTKNCAKCRTVCLEQNINKCQHCKTDLCGVCFMEHSNELVARYPEFVKQLEEQKLSLLQEQTAYEQHCNKLITEIEQGVQRKIQELQNMETAILKDVKTLQETGEMEIVHISDRITNLQASIAKQNEVKALNKVSNYMDYHHQMAQILDSISSLGVNYKQFNMATFTLDEPPSPVDSDTSSLYDEISNSMTTSPSLLCSYFKNKVYSPKFITTKFQKPTGVCFSPWDGGQIYVCNMRSIYVYDIIIGKVITRIQDDKMANCQSIACNVTTNEMFVSDRIGNVVHVFNTDGAYQRQLLPKSLSNPHGIAVSKNGDLLVCDTGNDRVLIVDCKNGKIKNTIGVVRDVTELSMPTDVATDGKIIVIADVGNHRVKIFDAETLLRRAEIGSFGKQKGQFRSAEAVYVDEGGVIIVGDSGNRRIQMFNSEGDFIISTSTEYKFNAISGVCTNGKGDIIITDYKNKSLVRF